ncbi:hypothetical protein [Persicirhabdus sediminis]|uniref:Uncharacterized protein n=1 Tax=Persicirhabdus sediminis TaxID=454144 RepID=A0A8J7MCF9_9BACT|nr:hypothetical protein [Persicirhabdus sediminis]MBK1790553.1 hypothetical protein [Persicirhabdus sediminis]
MGNNFARPLEDRVLVYALIIISSMVALISAFIVNRKHENRELMNQTEPEIIAHEVAQTNKGKWYSPYQSNLEEISNTFRQLTNEKRSYVIFTNGSVVPITEPNRSPAESAKQIIERYACPEVRFQLAETKEGNFMVNFEGRIIVLVYAKDMNENAEVLQDYYRGLTADEINALYLKKQELPYKSRIGILARSLLLADKKEPEIYKILKLKES